MNLPQFFNQTKTTNIILVALIIAGAAYWYFKCHKCDQETTVAAE